MTRSNARKPEGRKLPEASQSSHRLPTVADELVLHGDVSKLKDAFVSHPRRLLTCPVPNSIYLKLQNYPGGIGHFYEEAVASFDGDLEALVVAAVRFVEMRRYSAGMDPPRNASGRVLPATFAKVQQIEDALATIRGMSRAKVLAGIISLHLHV